MLDPGESCDGTQLLAHHCADIPGGGFQAGVPNCTSECTYDTSRCWTSGWSELETDGDRHLYAVGASETGLVVTAGHGSTVQVLDREMGRFVPLEGFFTLCAPGAERIVTLSLSPDGERLLLAGKGCQAYVVHLEGDEVSSCRRHTPCQNEPHRLRDVWALPDHSHAWIVSESDRVYRYDDATEGWTEQITSLGTHWAVWGKSASEIYVTGDDGVVLRGDGNQWSDLGQDQTDESLVSLWGEPDRPELYAVGSGGAVLLYDGSTWTDLNSDRLWTGGRGWRHIRGDEVGEIWLAGEDGLVGHFDGVRWQLEQVSPLSLEGVSVTGPEAEIVVVGGYGTALRYRGRYWTELTWEGGSVLNAAALLADDSLFAVGESGVAVRVQGANFTVTQPQGFSPTNLHGLWAGQQTILGVGTDGAACELASGQWTCTQVALGLDFAAVSGREAGWPTAVAVGSAGSVYWYDGLTWERDLGLTTTESLFGVWMDPAPGAPEPEVFAVGTRGAIWRFSAGEWEAPVRPDNPELDLYAVTGTPSRVVAVGDAGEVVQLDRGTGHWTRTSVGHQPLFAVWASPASWEVFAVGQGNPAYFDGEDWSLMAPPVLCKGNPRTLRALAGTASRNVFTVGDLGCALRFTGRMPAALGTPW